MKTKKQKLFNQEFSRTQIINNILRCFNRADKDMYYDWYLEANQFAASLGIDPIKAAGIIAALSPLKSWDENKRIAKEFIETGYCGHTKTMTFKAETILTGGGDAKEICRVLNGNKITSFFINICDPNNKETVTIDRHAISIAINQKMTKDFNLTDKQYQFLVDCYVMAANKLNLRPSMLQSITWLQWRTKSEISTENVPF